MIVCPPKHRAEYKELEAQIGEGKAHAAWIINGRDKIPTVDMAQELLSGNNSVIVSKMNEFVKGLNFDIQQFNDLKDITGYDATSAVDLINKVVLYGNGVGIDEVAKETAYVAYAMLGRKNKIVTDLRHSITELPNYKEILNYYKKKAPGLYTGKINELIVVDLIADAIKENGELPKDSYQNRKSEFWSIEGSSPLEKRLKYLIAKFISAIKEFLGKSKLNAKELKSLADDIANDILTKNYSKFQTRLKPDQQLINYENTLQKDPKAKAIIEDLQKIGLTLTGSLSLRKQGTLYRTAAENLHDLDFTFQNIRNTFTEQVYVDANLNDLIETVDTKSVKQLNEQLDKIPLIKDIIEKYPDYQVVNTFTAGKYTTIIGKIGEYAIDIFVDPTKSEQLDTIEDNFQDWKHIFAAKIQMGRAKDMLDFVNYKPFNRDETGQFAQMKGLRHFTFPTGTAEESVRLISAKFEGLSQQGPVQYTGKDTMTGWGDVRDTKGTSYSNITVDGWNTEDMKGKDIMEIIARKNELQEQGAVIRYMGENGFQWRMPENNIYFQLTNNTQRDELQQAISRGVSQQSQGDTIKAALDIFGTKDTTIKGSKKGNEQLETELKTTLKEFVTRLGGQVRPVDQLVVNSKVYTGVAVTDILNRTIDVIEGKAGEDTLPEEVGHLFTALLPADSYLLEQMRQEAKDSAIYDEVYAEYKDTDVYKNPDGSVNEEVILNEVIGKLISKAILNEWSRGEDKSTWQKLWYKLWKWVQKLVSSYRKDQQENPYDVVAQQILSGDISALDVEGRNLAKDRGQYYFQLNPKIVASVNERLKAATDVQKEVVKEVYLDVHDRVILQESGENYETLDEEPVILARATTRISGKKVFTKEDSGGNPIEDPYKQNREWGNDIDSLLQGVINGEDFEKIETSIIPEKVKNEVYWYFKGLISNLTSDGSIALTQVIVADFESKVAGSIDLLLIDPYGNMTIVDLKTSWHSIWGNVYANSDTGIGEGSVFEDKVIDKEGNIVTRPMKEGKPVKEPGDKSIKLPRKKYQSLQTGTYAKIIGLKGYPVQATRTEHILLSRDENDNITGWKPDNKNGTKPSTIVHALSENEDYIDVVVPTKYTGKDRLQELNDLYKTGNPLRRATEDTTAPTDEQQEAIEQRTEDIVTTAKDWRDYLKSLRYRGTDINVLAIQEVDELIRYMQEEMDKTEDYSKVYSAFLTNLEQNLDNLLTYLTDETNVNKSDYIRKVNMAKKYIDKFESLAYIGKIKATAAQQSQSSRVLQKLRNVDVAVQEGFKNTVEHMVEEWSVNPKFKDKEVLQEAVRGLQEDIGEDTKFLDTIGNSGNPILENLSKLLASARQDVKDSKRKKHEQIEEAGNNLIKAMGTKDPAKLYGWLVNKGRLLSQTGAAYWKLFDQFDNSLLSKEGKQLQYIENPVTAEDIDFNLNLYELKKKRGEFLRAEKVGKTKGKIWSEKGDYHELTQEFINSRKKYMVQDRRNGKWIPIDATDKAFIKWRTDHMDWSDYLEMETEYDPATRISYPTGIVRRTFDWFPKKEFVRIRETSSKETGSIKLWDDNYIKLINDKSPEGVAKYEYYKIYTSILNEEVSYLPPGAIQSFERGYIPTVGANFINQLKGADSGKIKLILSEMKDWFKFTAHSDSTIDQSLPIMYNTGLQNDYKINNLKELLAEHDKKKLIAGNQQHWLKEQRRLTALLEAETQKLKDSELEKDLTTGLKLFIDMAENYHIMGSVEDSVQAVKQQITELEYKQGNKKVKGSASRTAQLLNHMLEVIYYNDPNFTDSIAEIVGNRLVKFTSTVNIPLNIAGMINNKISGRIFGRIEAFGDSLFKHKAYNRAIKDYNKHIPEFVAAAAEHMASGKKYGERKPATKYEALVREFDMVRHLKSGEGRVGLLDWAYQGYEAGEWELQSLVGNAILGSIQMKYTGTDNRYEDCSIIDAYEFNKNTGKLTLIPGYVFAKGVDVATDQKQAKHLIVNRIHETNDRIYGNYAVENRIMLTRTLFGRMLLQFHKWVYPAFKARFQKGKFDENLGGGVDIEGRWRTLAVFTADLIKLGNMKDRWHELTDFQKANMKKDLADAVYIAMILGTMIVLQAVADGLDDDDPYLKKMVNWLRYQSDRNLKEVSLMVPGVGMVESYEMISEPFAAMGAVRNFAHLIKDMTAYPYRSIVDPEKNVYQRGNYKGMSKVEVDLLRLAPGGSNIRTWLNLQTVSSYYIGGR